MIGDYVYEGRTRSDVSVEAWEKEVVRVDVNADYVDFESADETDEFILTLMAAREAAFGHRTWT